MAFAAQLQGGLTNTHGSCPGCGTQVTRIHAWSNERSKDAYACPTCGTFEYATAGALLPERDRAAGPNDIVFDRVGPASSLQTILDPVDCVQ